MTMRFADLHCDTVVCQVFRSGYKKSIRENPDGHLDLIRMKEAGCLLQCFALYIPPMEQFSRYADDRYASAKSE